jgi:hypothetical protein
MKKFIHDEWWLSGRVHAHHSVGGLGVRVPSVDQNEYVMNKITAIMLVILAIMLVGTFVILSMGKPLLSILLITGFFLLCYEMYKMSNK